MTVEFPIRPHFHNPNHRTICEVLREIYRDAEQRGDSQTMARCNEAHDMAKRMDRRLRKYKSAYGGLPAVG